MKNLNVDDLRNMNEDAIRAFIRKRLSFQEGFLSSLRHSPGSIDMLEHKRFEMSGYEAKTGACTVWNNNILHLFADLGIYNYTTYLFLDFYKGSGTLYLQYFSDSGNYWGSGNGLEVELGGCGTVDIIYKIFEYTIFSEQPERRRI